MKPNPAVSSQSAGLADPPCYLGASTWAVKSWRGRLYTRQAKPSEYLSQYARVFNTVGGDTTFSGIPSPAALERWAAEVPRTFRFCFKFPKSISHDYGLASPFALREARAFVLQMRPIREKLGPLLLQLPHGFGRDRLPELAAFLQSLPHGYPIAIDLRSPEFFDNGQAEEGLRNLLISQKVGQIHSLTPSDFLPAADSAPASEIEKALHPSPIRAILPGTQPILQFHAYPQVAANQKVLMALAQQIALWVQAKLTPFVLIQTTDNHDVPDIYRQLHTLLMSARPPVPLRALPRFPGPSARA